MFPVLLSIGPISISSFGFFLALAFIFGSFLIWRLTRAWDLNEEKVLDLILLTFFGGLILSRIFFSIFNFNFFYPDLFKIVLITKYPGLNLWGGIIGGLLSLSFFCRRLKLNFWQVADFAAVGFLGGLILGDMGCFLGGCGIGITSNLFFAVPMVGVLGKRFPVQVVEALIFIIVLYKMWPVATHFHFNGKILSLSLIWMGLIKFITEFLRVNSQGGHFFSFFTVVLGLIVFYRLSKRNLYKDVRLLTDGNFIKGIIDEIGSSWYNQKLHWKFNLNKIKLPKILRRLRVKPTPENI